MSKLKYGLPAAEFIGLESKDIINSSTEAFDGEWVTIGGRSIDSSAKNGEAEDSDTYTPVQ